MILGTLTLIMLMAQLGSDGPASHTDLHASMGAQKMKASKTKENIEGQTHCFMARITQELPAGMCAHLSAESAAHVCLEYHEGEER